MKEKLLVNRCLIEDDNKSVNLSVVYLIKLHKNINCSFLFTFCYF